MTRLKAALILDPNQRAEQLAYLSQRAQILYEVGDQLWAAITPEQIDRLLAQGIGVQPHPEADLVELPALTFNPLAASPSPPTALSAPAPTADALTYYLVQFIAPSDPDWIDEIVELGSVYVQDLPPSIVVFRFQADHIDTVNALDVVQWVGPYHPAYALAYTLADRTEPFDATSLASLAIAPATLPTAESGNIRIRCFDDVDLAQFEQAIATTPATLVRPADSGFIVTADAPAVMALLSLPGVFSIEPFFAPRRRNNRGGVVMAAEQVRNTGQVDFLVNLNGAGEIVGVIDDGFDIGSATPVPQPAPNPPLPLHPDIQGRVLAVNNIATPGNLVPDTDTHNMGAMG
ncbi:MAG: hypothetical protein F6K19_41625, partial [Cyanothece sp. SIO1E1]|nr:hypothetical protein [Cyanothece sp. SIO1E1]